MKRATNCATVPSTSLRAIAHESVYFIRLEISLGGEALSRCVELFNYL